MSSKDDFGAELRRMRQQRGWSQEELAARAGVDQTSISQFERNKHTPAMERVARLARAFGMPVEEMARLAGHLPEPEPVEELIARTPLDQLLAALATIPEFRAHDQLAQVRAFAPPAQERLVRMVARDFANLIQGEIERLDEERREQERREEEREGQRNGGLAPAR